MRLGDILKIAEGKYLLQVGIMDLIGVPTPLEHQVAIIETLEVEGTDDRVLLIKGFAVLKLQFHRRPVPIMDRFQPKVAEEQQIYGKVRN